MKTRTLVAISLLVGLAVAVVPWLFPTGPSTGLDAARYLNGGQLAAGALVVFLGGLLTALTPCVYPLIPITVGIFGARKAEGRGKALILTSAYVVGMGLVFAALGVFAAKTGAAFGSMLGSKWVAAGLSVFLLALAASMFGAFELALPSGLTQKLNNVGGQGLIGALLMGAVSGFLAAPCTGPVLTGLLAFVAKTQSTTVGAGLLFIYAMGIGVPFFLIGVFTVRLPRGGVWMEWVKSLLGIMLVALAANYLKDAFPAIRDVVMGAAGAVGAMPGAWIAAVLACVGLLIGAVHRSFKDGSSQAALKALGLVMLVGALVLRGGAMNTGPTGTLWVRAGWQQPPKVPEVEWALRYNGAGALTPFDQALAQAKLSGRPVMIDFFAEWCAACKELDRETYVAPKVADEAKRFVAIKVDATDSTDALDALFERFGVKGLPTVAFVGSDGQILPSPRVTGFMEPAAFLGQLRQVR
jgi:thiol:disulfide interchange protein DsbD